MPSQDRGPCPLREALPAVALAGHEIGDRPGELQAKLLRALQEKEGQPLGGAPGLATAGIRHRHPLPLYYPRASRRNLSSKMSTSDEQVRAGRDLIGWQE